MTKITHILDSFFTNSDKNVFALKGDWGVGKTYFINNYIESSPHIDGKVVSYTSLFGLKSIEDLRSHIFYSSYKQASGVQDKARNLWIKALNLIKDVSVVKDYTTSLFELHKDLSAKDSVIVLDDLERRDAGLNLGIVFGLIAQLKEQFGCKIILILNEDQLDTPSLNDLKKYREKVIDMEIEFNPPISTNAKIFFKDEAFIETASEVYKDFDCNNLRVIKKSFHAFSDFKKIMNGYESEVQTYFLRQVIVLSCLYFLYGNKVDFTGLEQYPVRKILRRNEGETTEEERILSSVNFNSTDLDNVVIEYLNTGIIPIENAKEILDRMNEREKQGQVIEGLRKVFSIYRSNFKHGFKEFQNSLNSYLGSNISRIDWNSLSSACAFLKSNDKSGSAKKWIDRWLTINIPTISDKTFLSQLLEATENSKIKGIIMKKIKVQMDAELPQKIIFDFSRDKSWNPDEFSILLSYSENYYYKWLKSEESPDLLSSLRQFLRVFRNSAAGSPEKEFCNLLESVLRRIGRENKLNSLRITGLLEIPLEDAGVGN